jgi:hypothetical protein
MREVEYYALSKVNPALMNDAAMIPGESRKREQSGSHLSLFFYRGMH